MRDCATFVRNMLFESQPNSDDVVLCRLSSIARAVWLGDSKLAKQLQKCSDLGRKHLTFVDRKPALIDHHAFELSFATAKQKHLDGIKTRLESNVSDSPASKQKLKGQLERIDKLNALWASKKTSSHCWFDHPY